MSKIIIINCLIASVFILGGCSEKKADDQLIYITKESLEAIFSNRFQQNDSIHWIRVDWKGLEKEINKSDTVDLANYFTAAPKLSSFYTVNVANIKFDTKTYKIGERDSLMIQPEFSYTNMLNCCYLGNIDSIRQDSVYREKNKMVDINLKVEVPTSKLGQNKIEGMYELIKLDGSMELIPFVFEYYVEN